MAVPFTVRTRAALAEELRGALLAPEAALAIDVHGGTEAAVLAPLYLDAAGDAARSSSPSAATTSSATRARSRSPAAAATPRTPTSTATALREAHEEIGLPPEAVEIVGALPPTPTFVTNYAVYPFVGLIEPGFAWELADAEVAYVLEFPLEAVRAAHGMQPARAPRGAVPHRHLRDGRPPDLGRDGADGGRPAGAAAGGG